MNEKLAEKQVKREFWRRFSCSETMFTLLNAAAGYESKELEEASDPLCGGILAGLDCACGVLWGGALAAGVRAQRRIRDRDKARTAALEATRVLVSAYDARRGKADCADVTGLERWNMMKFLAKGDLPICQKQLVEFAPVFDREIDDSLAQSAAGPDGGRGATNCACESFRRTAEKIGLDPMEGEIVVAGLAGGLGLSGNGCGALAASIFAVMLKYFKERNRPKHSMLRSNLQGMRIGDGWMESGNELLREFVNLTGSKKCADITGRGFEDPDELTEHLEAGHCERLFSLLAETAGQGASG